MARSRSKIERSACGFETGFLGNGENIYGIDAIPSFENLHNGDHLAIIAFSSLLD